jgi:hypothetical protein
LSRDDIIYQALMPEQSDQFYKVRIDGRSVTIGLPDQDIGVVIQIAGRIDTL